MSTESDDKLAAELVGHLRQIFGRQTGRAAHAKGIVAEGHFTPTAEARALCTAAVFAGAPRPITVRYSNSTALTDIADTDDNASPHGMGIRFRVGESDNLDVVAHSFNGFPSPSARDFADLLGAVAESGPEATKPTALDSYLASHPIAATFLTSQKPPPESFATLSYFGVNAVTFIDAAGNRTHVRSRLVPQAGERILDAAARAAMGPNYLGEEIARRLARGPVTFDWKAQVAEAGDRLDDPSTPWPESRRLVTLGTLAIERLAADQAAGGKIFFGPGLLPPGIEPADPMLKIRDAAYFLSSKDRQ